MRHISSLAKSAAQDINMDYPQVSSSANPRYQIHLGLNSQTLKLRFYITVNSNRVHKNHLNLLTEVNGRRDIESKGETNETFCLSAGGGSCLVVDH